MNGAAGNVSEMKPEAREDAIALKFLELAREEILERMRFTNQLLVYYVAGISAFMAWMYNSGRPSSEPTGQAVAASLHIPHALLIPTAIGVSFLALTTSWVLHENEHMIERLAAYQKGPLFRYFHAIAEGIPLWECSDERGKAKSVLLGAMGVQSCLINAPNIALIIVSIWKNPRDFYDLNFEFVAVLLTLAALFFCRRMIRSRVKFQAPSPASSVSSNHQ